MLLSRSLQQSSPQAISTLHSPSTLVRCSCLAPSSRAPPKLFPRFTVHHACPALLSRSLQRRSCQAISKQFPSFPLRPRSCLPSFLPCSSGYSVSLPSRRRNLNENPSIGDAFGKNGMEVCTQGVTTSNKILGCQPTKSKWQDHGQTHSCPPVACGGYFKEGTSPKQFENVWVQLPANKDGYGSKPSYSGVNPQIAGACWPQIKLYDEYWSIPRLIFTYFYLKDKPVLNPQRITRSSHHTWKPSHTLTSLQKEMLLEKQSLLIIWVSRLLENDAGSHVLFSSAVSNITHPSTQTLAGGVRHEPWKKNERLPRGESEGAQSWNSPTGYHSCFQSTTIASKLWESTAMALPLADKVNSSKS